MRSSRAAFRLLGTNIGGSSATVRDWVTLKASPTPWDFVTDQFDACQLESSDQPSPSRLLLHGIPGSFDATISIPMAVVRIFLTLLRLTSSVAGARQARRADWRLRGSLGSLGHVNRKPSIRHGIRRRDTEGYPVSRLPREGLALLGLRRARGAKGGCFRPRRK